MIIKKLTYDENKELITKFFVNVFTKEPWYDDWSDTAQLDAYIKDLTARFNSCSYGFFEDENIDYDSMLALSMGSIKHWYRGTEYCIDEFCVKTNIQGKGIGSAFLDAVEKELEKEDVHKIYLQTGKTMPAFEFYQKRGFEFIPDLVSLYKSF